MQADLTRSADRAGYATGRLEWSASSIETALSYINDGRTDVARHVLELALGLDKQALKKLNAGYAADIARITGNERSAA